jgi:hypothetical protein
MYETDYYFVKLIRPATGSRYTDTMRVNRPFTETPDGLEMAKQCFDYWAGWEVESVERTDKFTYREYTPS